MYYRLIEKVYVILNIFLTVFQLIFIRINHIFRSNVKNYDMKSFVTYLDNSFTFRSYIYNLKKEIVRVIIGDKNYKNIVSRINYYSHNSKDKPPNENCINRIKRIFTNTPPTYHYDYALTSVNINNWEEGVSIIKQDFFTNISRRTSICKVTPLSPKEYTARLNTPKSSKKRVLPINM